MRQEHSSSPLETEVSAAVEVARRRRGLRPEAVCVAAGISRASYYNRISGTAGGWRLTELEQVAALLELPLVVLLEGPAAVLAATSGSSSAWIRRGAGRRHLRLVAA